MTEKTLKQKMAASVSGTGVSMVPAASRGAMPPPKEEEKTPDLDSLIADGEDKETLKALIKQHVELNIPAKQLEKKIKILVDRIKPILNSYGISGAFMYDGIPVNYFPQSRSTIDATKLLALGVDEATIAAATDTSISATLKITPPKGA